MKRCDYHMVRGWVCSRERGHDGPCALRTRWQHAGYCVQRAYAGMLWCAGLFICTNCRRLLGRRVRAGESEWCRACYKKIIGRR